ncbi:hypothetical protein GGF48_006088, partial [Coemansia sp. RSA 921]
SSSLDSDVTLSLNVDRESLEVGKGGQSGEWWEDSGEVEVESSSEALPLGSDATVSLNSDVESLEVEESGHQGEKWEDSGEEESSSETLSLGTSVTSSLLDVGGDMVDDSDMGGMVDCEMGCDVDVLWKLPSVLLPESRLDDGSILSSELKSLLLAKLLSLTCSDGLTDSDGDHDWSLVLSSRLDEPRSLVLSSRLDEPSPELDASLDASLDTSLDTSLDASLEPSDEVSDADDPHDTLLLSSSSLDRLRSELELLLGSSDVESTVLLSSSSEVRLSEVLSSSSEVRMSEVLSSSSEVRMSELVSSSGE